MKLEFYTDAAGEWRWRFVADNHKIIAVSSEGYHNLKDCQDGWELVASYACDVQSKEPEFVQREERVADLIRMLESEGSIVNQHIQFPVNKLRALLDGFKE
jgi:uncharacterized protein YegP (UPF0339 family)